MSGCENQQSIPAGNFNETDERTRRRQLDDIRKRLHDLLDNSISDLGAVFSDILPIGMLQKAQRDARSRVFPEVVVFWAWISQMLESNSFCADALTRVQNWYDSAGLPVPAFDISGYCRARKRLSGEFLEVVEERSRKYSEERIEDHHLWSHCTTKTSHHNRLKISDLDCKRRMKTNTDRGSD